MRAFVVAALLFFECYLIEPINAQTTNVDPLKIGAFNVRVFGVTKIKKKDVSDILVKVSFITFSIAQKL